MSYPPFRVGTGDEWIDFREGLEGEEVGLFAVNDSVIENGSRQEMARDDLYLGPVDRARGEFLIFLPELASQINEADELDYETPLYLGPDDTNDADFYLGQSFGSPWEFKVDTDYSLEQQESWHVHDATEVYATRGGELLVAMAGPDVTTDPDQIDENQLNQGAVYDVADEYGIVEVPPYVPHRVEEERGDPDHIITRYGNDQMSKYDIHGNVIYGEGESFALDTLDGVPREDRAERVKQ